MNSNIVNNIILAGAAPETASTGGYWGWIWLWAFLFFLLGFIVGSFIWRSLSGNVYNIEEENRRTLAAFKKREQAYLDNRKNATSILGQQDGEVREIRR